MGRQVRTGGRSLPMVAAMVAGMVLALLLSGCSGGGADTMSAASEDSGSAGGLPAGRDASASVGGGESESDSGDVSAPGRTQVQTRAVISTGEVQLEASDLLELRFQIDRLLGRFGGFVAREETHSDDDGRTSQSTLQLRVPSQHFETVMGSFAELATVVDTSRRAEDVTTEVIDVDSRIRTQEISLERLRTFLGRATKVADMIRLESEIARREADLASLRAQQDFLADQTSLATITVRAALPPEKLDDDQDPLKDAGFLTGLRNGWEALTDVAVVAATAAGALLPFLGVLTLLLVPLMVWVRTGRRRRQPVPASPPVG